MLFSSTWKLGICKRLYIFVFNKNWSLKKSKNLSIKYDQKLLDYEKQFATVTLKPVPKRAIQKTAERTGDLIGKNIAD